MSAGTDARSRSSRAAAAPQPDGAPAPWPRPAPPRRTRARTHSQSASARSPHQPPNGVMSPKPTERLRDLPARPIHAITAPYRATPRSRPGRSGMRCGSPRPAPDRATSTRRAMTRPPAAAPRRPRWGCGYASRWGSTSLGCLLKRGWWPPPCGATGAPRRQWLAVAHLRCPGSTLERCRAAPARPAHRP